MIDPKKITRYRRKYIKHLVSSISDKYLVEKLENIRKIGYGETGPQDFTIESNVLWMRYIPQYTLAANDADLQSMKLNYSVAMSFALLNKFATKDELDNISAMVDGFSVYEEGRLALFLQGAGWFNEASDLVYSGLGHSKRPISAHNRNKLGWFAILSTFDDWDHFKTIEKKGYYPPSPNNIDIYWMLAECWDDPDPLKVKNTLTAVREHNVAGNLMAEFSTPDTKDEQLLFFDYEVRAINMRRMALGLEMVVLDQDYAIEPKLPMERIPFAKDDVVWPAYLKTCEHFGTKPYEPKGEVINVTLDRTTGVASLV